MGVILTPEYNPFVHEVIQGIHKAQEEFNLFGIEIEIKMLSTLEPAEQIGFLNYFENEHLAGVAVFPLNDEQVVKKINMMRENGTAIITFNSQIKAINDICFIGQNHHRGGRTAAGLMSKLLPDGGDVGVIISSKTLSCHQYRHKGFEDKINAFYPDLSIVEVRENQDRIDTAFKIMLEYTESYPNLKGIYITGGGCAGVGRALEMTELAGKIKVICHDVIPDTIKLLKNGIVDFALGQNPKLQGYLLVKTLFDYLIKHQVPDEKMVDIPIEIFTADIVD